MQYMVIEKFRDQNAAAVYERLRDQGRLMPDGLTFLHSWVSGDLGRCFQIVECDDITLVQRWIAAWADLVAFEVVPVSAGTATAHALDPRKRGG